MLNFKKYRVCRFAPSPVSVLDKFPHCKIFSPCTVKISHRAVNLMISMQNLNKNRRFSLCGNWLRIDGLYSGWRIYRMGRDFLPYGEKNLSPCGNLSRTRTGLGAKQRTLYILKFNIKNENFKILNPSPDG
jgi:hypothetical protein